MKQSFDKNSMALNSNVLFWLRDFMKILSKLSIYFLNNRLAKKLTPTISTIIDYAKCASFSFAKLPAENSWKVQFVQGKWAQSERSQRMRYVLRFARVEVNFRRKYWLFNWEKQGKISRENWISQENSYIKLGKNK